MTLSRTALRSPVDFFTKLPWKRTATNILNRIRCKEAVLESMLFFRAWTRNPAKVGALLPSSPALSSLITRDISGSEGPVLELGCGTGVFTRKILQRGVAEKDLILIELDPLFAQRLRLSFPEAQILCTDASKLYRHPALCATLAGASICGLPLLNMPTHKKLGILRGVFSSMRRDGALYLFSYGLRCPVNIRLLDRLGLRARRVDTVLLNFPPARVWKLTRRPDCLDAPSALHQQG